MTGVVDGDVFGVAEGLEEQQSRNVTPSDVGQQSPDKFEQAECAEHAASIWIATDDGESDGRAVKGRAIDGVTDGADTGTLEEQQLRKVTPSDVGQQSPSKLEH